jgi:hypothetical protein
MEIERTKQYVTEKKTCKECGHTNTEMIPIEEFETDMSVEMSSHKRGYEVNIEIFSKKELFPDGIRFVRNSIKDIFEELNNYLPLCETGKGVAITSDKHSLVIKKRVNEGLLDQIVREFKSKEEKSERWFEPHYRKAVRQKSLLKKA